jgi:hypothetical protein
VPRHSSDQGQLHDVLGRERCIYHVQGGAFYVKTSRPNRSAAIRAMRKHGRIHHHTRKFVESIGGGRERDVDGDGDR